MSTQVHPEITWAQRSNPTDPAKNILFIGINTPDVSPKDADLKITPTSVKLNAKSGKGVEYVVDLELFDEIVPEESKQKHSARGFDLVLRKKEKKEEYWPRLLKEKAKVHFLKTDFDKVCSFYVTLLVLCSLVLSFLFSKLTPFLFCLAVGR